jgi:hypothetical protein
VASSIEELDDAPWERVTRCRLSVTEGAAGSYADAIRELDGLSHVICLRRIDTVSSAQGFGLGTAAPSSCVPMQNVAACRSSRRWRRVIVRPRR